LRERIEFLEKNSIGAFKEEKEKAMKSLEETIQEKDFQLKQQSETIAEMRHQSNF